MPSSTVVVVVAVAVADGVRLADRPPARRVDNEHCPESDLGRSLYLRGRISGVIEPQTGVTERALMDEFAAKVLVVPSGPRWREAMSTALLGDWSDPLVQTGCLHDTAVGALRAEARSLHKALTPLWRRGTRHGRVLSLDAKMGDGLSFYDLIAADIDLLARVTGGVLEDDRLNRVLRGLNPAERATVFVYAEGGGTTWAEAAAAAGAADPDAFGERVRRKVKRLAAEQARRTAMTCPVREMDQHVTPDGDAL
ncbi:hypothetical protein [Streptomyces doebereineriae]|uniref:Uncharacterized protein n=1 Tax=Streptomyces doebereineriae TaxID=3075528 RepID=A0ABU2VRB8_9ACTN|nr:hypothetical protein [Streptomyces sp. DSM 41640]MDT0488168.1 hypothetical protein [Streptomyces sp. DSM 41640]